MAKRNQSLTLVENSRGQISIFFSASLVVLITIIAFVINIGLFVKAKINLQNATDAAAFSGAAVQARQLSTIAYMNWEMRNIYKEWMYKYYVVGNLNIKDVEDPNQADEAMSFRLEPDVNVLAAGTNRAQTIDPYNIPAVCIHVEGSKTNICRRYAIPGLPEFGSSNLPGAEEASRAFMDALIGNKVDDCITRTKLNMLVTSTWAYNVLTTEDLDATLVGRGPAILANRQGAWPKAVEVAMRMRNLEKAMNRKAETSGVCINGSTTKTNCSKSISSIGSEKNLGNERLVKAFYSGYRNLGNDVDNEMKNSFTLTELPPKEVQLGNKTSASYLLIPENEVANYTKQYVDLKLMMVNYATFYDAMIPRAESDQSGACDISKVAIPIPGYPLGFYKNPDVLTYYAVKGEAEFEGMFNPFTRDGNIKMTAYAAAKPFGGRIGPMLFTQKPNQDFIVGRTDAGKFRSIPYLTSLKFEGTKLRNRAGGLGGGDLALGQFASGVPLPINFPGADGYFWLEDPDKAVGGLVSDGSIQFGIPNLVYDYQEPFRADGYSSGSVRIHKIDTSRPKGEDQAIGLFSREQFKAFRGTRIGTELTTQKLMEEEIARVKAPTLYEAANYLVPTPNEFNIENKIDSFGFIPGAGAEVTNGLSTYTAFVYAPLYDGDQQDVFWKSSQDVVFTIFEFMRAQKSAVDKYKKNLNRAAREINDMANNVAATATGSRAGYQRAAAGVSDINFADNSDDQEVGSCKSLAGSFLWFYYGAPNLFQTGYVKDPAGCPTPLGTQLVTYFTNNDATSGFSATHYKLDFSWKPDNFPKSPQNPKSHAVFSAYQPGPFTGIENGGQFTNPITGDSLELMRRNFYSTKFVALDSLQNGAGYSEASNFVIYSEGTTEPQGTDTPQSSFKNELEADSLGLDLSSIKY